MFINIAAGRSVHVSISFGAVAGIVVGVFVFTALVAVSLTLLVWCSRYRRRRRPLGSRNPGFDNINYGEVDGDATRKRGPSDYEVPQPTHRYINIPAHNKTTPFTGSSGSGVYSCVPVSSTVRHTPTRSYDSHFLQSSDSIDLPTIVAAESPNESANGRITSKYVLLQKY